MVDNIELDAGTGGATVRTDDDGSAHWQYVKLAYGADNTQTIVTSTATNPLPVALSDTDNAVLDTIDAVLDTINAKLVTGTVIGDVNVVGDSLTALQLIDNIVLAEDSVHNSGDSGVMSLAVRNDTLAALAGTDGDYAPLQVNSSGALYTEISTALPAGTNAIGKLSANSGVDIGDVDILSVIPGTGATNLGKAVDSVVGATDTGIAILAKHKEDFVHLSTADGDYEHLEVNSIGALSVSGEQFHVFDTLDATTGWTALGNDTLNLATTTIHALGSAALTFDKVDGAANTVLAGIQKTLSSTDLGTVSPHDIIQTVCYVSSITDIDYAFVRIGTDSSNYNEWRIDGANLTAGEMEILSFIVGDTSHAGSTGTGVDWSAITYIVIGCAFNAESDTLSGIIFDEISYHTNQHTASSIQSEVTSSVSSSNVNIQKVGGSAVDKNSGNLSNGSIRVAIGTDDVNLSAIKTATELIDNIVQAEDAVHGSGDSGVMSLAVRNDTLAALAGTDGDYAPVQANAEGAIYVRDAPSATGGNSFYKTIDLDEGEEQVKATAGTLYSVFFTNTNASVRFLKIYNATAASVTVGTTVPDITLQIPTDNSGIHAKWDKGLAFSTAITIAATTGVADNDSGAPGANEIVGVVEYK